MNAGQRVFISLWTVTPKQAGLRPDRFLRKIHPALKRDEALALLKKGQIRVNEKASRLNTVLQAGDKVALPSDSGLWAQPTSVIFADMGWAVLDKAPGLALHPGTGIEDPSLTLMGQLLSALGAAIDDGKLSFLGRLDRHTSGLVLVAWTNPARGKLGHAMDAQKIKKNYLAWVRGEPPADFWIRESLPSLRDRHAGQGSRPSEDAETHVKNLVAMSGFSLVQAMPITGRKHQIRRHLASAGWPIVGDARYGDRRKDKTLLAPLKIQPERSLFLHAHTLHIEGEVDVDHHNFRAQVPQRMVDVADLWRGDLNHVGQILEEMS